MNHLQEQQFHLLIEKLTKVSGIEKDTKKKHVHAENTSPLKNNELARQRAAVRRWKATESLDRYLIEFEANFIKTGAKVLWARDVKEANDVILEILKKNFVKEVYAPYGAIINEIKLKQHLVEEDIAITPVDNTEALTSVMITEASCFVADPGLIVLNGNISSSFQAAMSKCRIVISVAGINDVLPNLGDLSLFLPLKATYRENSSEDDNTTFIFSPRKAEEGNQTNDLYFLIIDNGRSNLLADKDMRQTTWCINCGACNGVCPVNETIGTEEGVYEGPIMAVKAPFLKDFEEQQYLTRASSLCGACTQICPVHINLHELFIYARHKALALQLGTQKEKWFYHVWKKTMLKRDKFNFGTFKSNRLVIETVYEKVWGTKDNQPAFARKSFNQLWKERSA